MSGSSIRPRDAVYFLHIPKTAGSSLHRLLVDQYGERLCPFRLWDDLDERNIDSLANYDAFSGHFGMALPKYLRRPVRTFTFLRNSVDRTVSHFLHVKRDTGHPYHRYVSSFTLDDFLEDPITLPLVYNWQARYLASANISGLDAIPRVRLSGSSKSHGQAAVTWELMTFGLRDSQIRTFAEETIRRMHFVGFVEAFEASTTELSGLLGFDGPVLYRYNVASNRSDIETVSQKTIERIKSLTQIDSEVYELARSLKS
jgi:hypothetical protein